MPRLPSSRARFTLAAVLSAFLGAANAGPPPPADPAYRASVESWRGEYEKELRSEDGWLSVAGLFWLKPGPNRIGTARGSEIVLPEGSGPAEAAVIVYEGGRATVRLAPGVSATLREQPLSGPAALDPGAALRLGRLSLFVIERGKERAIRLRDPENPRRQAFAGTVWFPIDERWRVEARFEAYSPARTIPIVNVLGMVAPMRCPGRAVFRLGGRELSLEPVAGEHDRELFLIFRDETAGHETYGAGRFLYAEQPKDGKLLLDFNRAESPPCAYTDFATCPLPPKQNRLPVRIEAGEKSQRRH